MNFFMDYIFPWLVAALMLFICLILGAIPASAVAGGASSVLMWGLLCGAIMAAACGWLVYMYADMELSNPWLAAIIGGMISFGVTMYYPADTLINGHKYAEYTRNIAPHVETFGLTHFEQIDNGDGTITDEEMDSALANLRLGNEELLLLNHMKSAQSDVGHVIGSYTTTTYVWISTGNGGGYMSPVTTTHYIYGISRADLESYPARMVEKWKHW